MSESTHRSQEGGITIGLFEALLHTPSIRALTSEGPKQIREYLRVHEFELAFDMLTAMVVQYDIELSEDAWAVLEYLGDRLRAKPEDWHGLQRH